MSRRIAATVALAAVLLIPATTSADRERVVIRDTLRPAVVEIEPGTTVTWVNRDDERHRMRSKEGPVRFDSKNLERGERYSFTFTVPGEYPYYDHRNRDDAAWFGTVVVVDVGSGGERDSPVQTAQVGIVDDAYTTPRVTLAAGGTVEWVNRGADEHTVSANDLSFDSGSMPPGARFSMSFDAPGEYPYFCQIHPEMRATVIVVEDAGVSEPTVADGAAAQPAPDPVGEPVSDDAASIGSALEVLATPPPADGPSIGSALELLATPPPE